MWESKEVRADFDRKRYGMKKDEILSKCKIYRLENKERINHLSRIRMRKNGAERKYECLEYYSSPYSSVPKCANPECGITDVDILTIDHIYDNGAEHRKSINWKNCGTIYKYLKKNKFPPGYQVLCFNHNWKKEILRRRMKNQEVN